MFGGAKLQSFLRLKLSLSLRQWSRDFTNLKLRVKKIKKEFLFFKILLFWNFKKASLLSQLRFVVCKVVTCSVKTICDT